MVRNRVMGRESEKAQVMPANAGAAPGLLAVCIHLCCFILLPLFLLFLLPPLLLLLLPTAPAVLRLPPLRRLCHRAPHVAQDGLGDVQGLHHPLLCRDGCVGLAAQDDLVHRRVLLRVAGQLDVGVAPHDVAQRVAQRVRLSIESQHDSALIGRRLVLVHVAGWPL